MMRSPLIIFPLSVPRTGPVRISASFVMTPMPRTMSSLSVSVWHFLGAHLGQRLFVGLGILAELVANEALAVAHEPYLATAIGVDDG